MIIDFLISAVVTVISGLLGLLPAYTLPPALAEAAGSIGAGIGTANAFFPVGTLGLCIGLIIGAKLWLTAWDLIAYVYTKFPFKAT